MNNLPQKFNIHTFVKDGFDLVVELDDEVEYLIDKDAVTSIKNNEPTVILKRLIDGEKRIVPIALIIKSLQTEGPIDYLKKK